MKDITELKHEPKSVGLFLYNRHSDVGFLGKLDVATMIITEVFDLFYNRGVWRNLDDEYSYNVDQYINQTNPRATHYIPLTIPDYHKWHHQTSLKQS